MAKVRYYDHAQVMAAQLAVQMAREDGREPDPRLVRIAEAKPVPEDDEAERDDTAG
jgi:hypothetical protein